MKTTPNTSMFLDFILDNHEKSIRQFKKYIISVLSEQTDTIPDLSDSSPSTPSPTDTSTPTPDTSPETDTSESFVNQNNSGIIGKISKIFESGFQRFLLMIHLRGNKFFVNKTTY